MHEDMKPMTGADFLEELGAGTTAERWLEEITYCAQRCKDTNGKGKVVLEVEMEIKEDRVNYAPKIKTNLPNREQMPTSFYLNETAGGHPQITRTDPNQPELIPMSEQRPAIERVK